MYFVDGYVIIYLFIAVAVQFIPMTASGVLTGYCVCTILNFEFCRGSSEWVFGLVLCHCVSS